MQGQGLLLIIISMYRGIRLEEHHVLYVLLVLGATACCSEVSPAQECTDDVGSKVLPRDVL